MSDILEPQLHTMQKPDVMDSPIYEKPNAYDDEMEGGLGHQPPIIPNQMDCKEQDEITLSPEIPRKPHAHEKDVYFSKPHDADQRGSHSPDLHSVSPTSTITSSLLSPSTATTHTISDDLTVSLNSLTIQGTKVPSLANPSPTTSSSSFDSVSRDLVLQALSRKHSKNKPDNVVFDIHKSSRSHQPHSYDIFWNGTKRLAYRKVLDHSYSWGFSNGLYRYRSEDIAGEGVKVVEARRPAFQKDIVIEWGDFEGSERLSAPLINKSQLFFMYQTKYKDYKLRWKRPSLLSRDMHCDILVQHRHRKGTDSDDEDHPKEEAVWKTIAQFDSHRLGLVLLGRLAIDRQVLQAMDEPDMFEGHLILTCCTLVDLMTWLSSED